MTDRGKSKDASVLYMPKGYPARPKPQLSGRKAPWHPKSLTLTICASDGKIIVWDVSGEEPSIILGLAVGIQRLRYIASNTRFFAYCTVPTALALSGNCSSQFTYRGRKFMCVWIASSCRFIDWMGGSCFAKLASATPQNGGTPAYPAYAYGPLQFQHF
ncbi:hypothetical protein BT96DRAFT_949520 [Gymnopus androsaceus JB14]|uniref:Uncharacterized protein n=1 Tax=Gymnopus androsaceus JB14 TaxID=1447944 RepID=A0A6A4GJS7_9AGAR|nr:hypothetical protein BT96DRAFT_949520 [Gymnopus androsaceus JB14]